MKYIITLIIPAFCSLASATQPESPFQNNLLIAQAEGLRAGSSRSIDPAPAWNYDAHPPGCQCEQCQLKAKCKCGPNCQCENCQCNKFTKAKTKPEVKGFFARMKEKREERIERMRNKRSA